MRYLIILLASFLFVSNANADEMIVKKISLSKFKPNTLTRIPSKEQSPYWPEIDRHTLTIDDNNRIYVLDIVNMRVLVFHDDGKKDKAIKIPVKMISKDYVGYGQIEVSAEGDKIFIKPPPGEFFQAKNANSKIGGITLDNNGNIINTSESPYVDKRLCNETYIDLHGRYVYDENFHLLKEQFAGYSDSEGKYKHIAGKHRLIKFNNEGKQLWEKRFDGNFGIIGVDRSNYIYIEGRLRKGDPNSLYKLNSEGKILAQVRIPDPFAFLSKEEKEEWDLHASEEFLDFFKLTCNGDVYLIYQLTELPKRTFERWLKGGEYFIYKFETKK
jgi:hypothetical protein